MECRKRDHEYLLYPFGLSVLEHLANCLKGFKCHFDAMVFQNSLNWLRGPANVWNCAISPYRFRKGGCIFHRWFKVAGIQDEALGVSIGLQCRYYSLFFLNLVGFCCGNFCGAIHQRFNHRSLVHTGMVR